MPTPPASSRTDRPVRTRRERAERSLGQHPGARGEPGERRAVVAGALHRDPHQLVARYRGQRVRMRLPPQAAGEEAPPEELPWLGRQLFQVPPLDVDRHGVRRLLAHARHPELMAREVPEGHRDPVPEHERRDDEVQGRPPEPRDEAAGEGGAHSELVAERERDRQVCVEVQVVPGFVAHPAAHRAGGDHGDAEQQEPGDRRHQHVGVGGEQRRGLADRVGVRGDGVAPGDRQRVAADQPDHVPAAHGVPPGQPVRADRALDGPDAGHQQHQHDDGVAGQQAEDLPGAGQPAAESGEAEGAVPPEGEDGDRAGRDGRQQCPRADGGSHRSLASPDVAWA